MRRGDLLLMYLEGADLLLDTAIEGLGEGNSQTQAPPDLSIGRDVLITFCNLYLQPLSL